MRVTGGGYRITVDRTTPGTVVGGRYRLTERIGSGGMGTVWAAHDEVLDREVAVKEVVPPLELDEEQRRVLRERIMREARAAARISSATAVAVYDVVEADGRPWIVMERLAPRTLAQALRERGPMPSDVAARMGIDVLAALEAAHAAGVLHRDVKPANVMLTDAGTAVLTDFGIATLEGDPSLTSTGALVGSPAYMAPERARGHPPSRASDLWSLGATLYAAVEGRAPFDRQGQLPTLAAVIHDDAPHPHRAGALAPAITALLDKDPARRPDATQLRGMLERAALSAPPQAVPPAPQGGPLPGGQRSQPLYPDRIPAAAPPTRVTQQGQPAPVEPVRMESQPVAPMLPATRRRGRSYAPLAVLAALLLAGLLTASALLGLRDESQSGPLAVATDTGEVSTTPDVGVRGNAAGPGPNAEPDTSTNPGPDNSGIVEPEETKAEPEETEAEPEETDDANTGGAGVGVPAGFDIYRDETGFSLAIPTDWRVSTDGPRRIFEEPDTGRFLIVDQTDTPQDDALEDWEQQSEALDLPGYHNLRVESAEWRDWDAADWEFTWEADDGPRHVLNRTVITEPGEQAYALYWSTPESEWDYSLATFDVFERTFRPVE